MDKYSGLDSVSTRVNCVYQMILRTAVTLFAMTTIFGCASEQQRKSTGVPASQKIPLIAEEDGSQAVIKRIVIVDRGVQVPTNQINLKLEVDRANIEFTSLNEKSHCFDITAIIDDNYTKILFSQRNIDFSDSENVVVGQVVRKLGCSGFRGVSYWFDKSTRSLVRTVYER
jgi:hypothetical protein